MLKADYGQDAPVVVRRLTVVGAIGLCAGLALLYVPALRSHRALGRLGPSAVATGLSCLGTAAVMTWGSRVGKLQLRDRILGQMTWRGDEQVLDVGCGHGLMLIGAAKRLTTGKATGVDIWQEEDQAGNSAAATQENSRREGVADRTELVNGDARALPFENDRFDVILSSWALHNIYDREERRRAVREIARVLKPGGRVAAADIRHADDYANEFRAVGLVAVRRSWPNFLFVTPTVTVFAEKPLG